MEFEIEETLQQEEDLTNKICGQLISTLEAVLAWEDKEEHHLTIRTYKKIGEYILSTSNKLFQKSFGLLKKLTEIGLFI